MNEKQFHILTDETFLRLEEWLERSHPDIDFETQHGTLVVLLPDQSQVVLSCQTSLQEIWLASNQGAYHFQWQEDEWVTRQGKSLWQVMAQVVQSEGE